MIALAFADAVQFASERAAALAETVETAGPQSRAALAQADWAGKADRCRVRRDLAAAIPVKASDGDMVPLGQEGG